MTPTFIILFVIILYANDSFCQTREIDGLKNLLSNTKNDTIKINTLNQLAELSVYSLGDDTSAMNYANEALDLSEKLNFKRGMRDAYNKMGYAAQIQDNYLEAIRLFNLSLKLSNKINDKWGMAYAHLELAKCFFEGDRTEKLQNLLAALKIYKEIGDKWGISATLQSIAIFYQDENNYDEALKTFYEALTIREKFSDKTGEAQTLNTIGGIHATQGKYGDALQNFNKALRIFEQQGENAPIWGLPYTYACIAGAYVDEAEKMSQNGNLHGANEGFKKAMDNYKLALPLQIKANIRLAVAELELAIGNLNFRMNNYKEANKYFQQSLARSRLGNGKKQIRDVYLAISRLDSASNNYKQALLNYKNYILYRDSSYTDEDLKRLDKLKMQNVFDKKQDSLNRKQIITQTKLDSQKKQKNFYLAGAGLLALLSVFVFLNFRNQKKINRLANDAHAKEKAELELQSLRAQLNPHFMFNSLNAIQELILLEENEKSQSYLARFAKLLRLLLENADKPFIPLQMELDFLQLYLSLENLRIPDLQFSITVDPNINTETTQIPNMILQPYIENSIWHGLSHKENNKQLQIRINNEDGSTKYEVEDNGVGRKRSAELKSFYRKEHRSKGMELLSKRFRLLAKEYGAEVETTITDVMNGKENGTIVTIKVPNKIKSI